MGSGNPSRTSYQPRIEHQGRPQTYTQEGDPLYPSGSLTQQIQSLRKYQQALKTQIRELREQQAKIIQHSEKLRKTERSRRRR
jgi:hypothetical protein